MNLKIHAGSLKILGFFIVISLLVLAPGLLWPLVNMPTLSFMMLGAFIIHMSMRPGRWEVAATLALAALFRVAYSSAGRPFVVYFGSNCINWGGFLGSASLLALFVRACRPSDRTRKQPWYDFFTASALPYTWLISSIFLGSGVAFGPTNDALLCAFDASLGGLLSFSLGALLARYPILMGLTQTVYNALPLAAAFLLAGNRRSAIKPVRVIPLYISMMLFATLTYWLYPAAGPIFAYPDKFPLAPPRAGEILAQVLTPFSAPHNAMPSLHFGAMLVLMWNCRAWRWPARCCALGFALATAFSTLALGEHYLIDLVVAFPYIATFQAVWTTAVPLRSPRRFGLIVVGTLLVAAWMVALRFAVPVFLNVPFLSWVSIIATVAIVVVLERSLYRASLTAGSSRRSSPAAAVAAHN